MKTSCFIFSTSSGSGPKSIHQLWCRKHQIVALMDFQGIRGGSQTLGHMVQKLESEIIPYSLLRGDGWIDPKFEGQTLWTVLYHSTKFHQNPPRGSMGCHRLHRCQIGIWDYVLDSRSHYQTWCSSHAKISVLVSDQSERREQRHMSKAEESQTLTRQTHRTWWTGSKHIL